jgi:hypothetical protein
MIEQDQTVQSSARCRYYKIAVSCGLPADLTGENGLGWMETTVSTLPSGQRTLSASGYYTAIGSDDAYTQCTDEVYTVIEAITSTLTGTWERVVNDITYGRTNKRATFNIVYVELIYDQSADGRNDTDVKQAVLNYRIVKPGVEVGSQLVDRPNEFQLTYTAWVDTGTDPDTKWTGELRPWLVNTKLPAFTAAPLNIIDSESYSIDRTSNRIEVILTGRSYASGGGLLSYTYMVQTRREWGWRLAPLWSGNPFAKDVVKGPQRLIRTRIQQFIGQNLGSMRSQIGKSADRHLNAVGLEGWHTGGTSFGMSADPGAAPPVVDNWYQILATTNARPIVFGQRDTPRSLVAFDEVVVEEFAAVEESATAGGGEGGGERPLALETSVDRHTYATSPQSSAPWNIAPVHFWPRVQPPTGSNYQRSPSEPE